MVFRVRVRVRVRFGVRFSVSARPFSRSREVRKWTRPHIACSRISDAGADPGGRSTCCVGYFVKLQLC